MKKIITLVVFVLSCHVSLASWWTFDSLNWNRSGIPHTLHLVSQIAQTGIQIKSITQHHSVNDDSLFVSCTFTDCGGFQSFYTWDSTIQLQATADLLNYHLVLYIGYDTNTVNPNCNTHLTPILDTFYLGNSGATAIPAFPQIGKLTVWPNPARDVLRLELPYNQKPKIVHITTLYGTQIKQALNTRNIDIASLAAGTYLIDVKTGTDRFFAKFVKEE